MSRELRTTLVTSLFFPILDYCFLVYNDLTEELNTKLQQLINCGIHFIIDLRGDVHISPFRLWGLTVRSRRLYFLGRATFNSSPSLSFALLPRFVRRATSPLLYLHTSTFRNSFYLSAIYFLHSLRDPIRSSPAIGILKGRLFGHLFGLDNDSDAP